MIKSLQKIENVENRPKNRPNFFLNRFFHVLKSICTIFDRMAAEGYSRHPELGVNKNAYILPRFIAGKIKRKCNNCRHLSREKSSKSVIIAAIYRGKNQRKIHQKISFLCYPQCYLFSNEILRGNLNFSCLSKRSKKVAVLVVTRF